ncbi:hypothetical protein HANVADRAFT_3202 [Hanseniaspora valbyensis NRRL Y-1626]|uniref:Aminopeptidase P N-terminal domain-containing protein n=1 Tax=Hanseniaspora valbyensis NRRL Y-1626 TaxID=766949 RepID=A0A1B7TBA3_9ASCO|nr:hypothetical protein HANVADRAFT_3202 [Hanseniaspora valbyensis NRRL Y-1626]
MDSLPAIGSLVLTTSALTYTATKKYLTNNEPKKQLSSSFSSTSSSSVIPEDVDTSTLIRELGFDPIKNRASLLEKDPYLILKTHKYPAKKHCSKIVSQLQSITIPHSSAIINFGNNVEPIKYCDTMKPFRQKRYFYYLSGVEIPGSAIFYDIKNDKLTLFLQDVDEDDIMWSGEPISIKEALDKYDVDEVLYMKDMASFLADAIKEKKFDTVYIDDLDNLPKKISLDGLNVSVGSKEFFFAIDESRVIKDAFEIACIKKACEITDNCHLATWQAIPIEKNEIHLQAEFTYHAIRQGSVSQGYEPICCSGTNCSTLHYVKNDEDIKHRESILLDAGAEFRNYTADITRCFPINGKWTKEHREIYEIVLDVQQKIMKKIKPNVLWDDLQKLAHELIIFHLKRIGVFKKEFSDEEIYKRRASACFLPHGLGHQMGLDVHDVGGMANYDDSDPYFKNLRIRRPLEANMVITNEPGVYFNKYVIDNLLKKFPERLETVNMDVVEKYAYVGGVRIEDDVLVTENGCEVLSGITSDPDEIEKIVTNALKKGRYYFHNVV